VGYSAGLINHFFRGRLNLARSGATGTNWTISNLSASTTGAVNGTFVVLAEDANHNRTQIPGATWSLNIPAGGSTTVSFTEPAASTANLVLAFSGQIGAEPANFNDAGWFAVAGKVVKYTPPSSCTAPRSDAGSSAGITYTRDLGPVAGTVELQFEAFSIPDGIQVKYANGHTPDPVAYTGLVSGFRDKTFEYDPAAAGTQQVQLKVTGDTDSNTEWVSVLGCPNQPITAANGGTPRETVQFNFGGALSGATGSCSATVSIDGAVVGTAQADASSPHGFGLVLTKAVPQAPGQGSQHVLTYSNYQCSANLRNVTTGATYTDAAGTHAASDMSSLNPFLFDVN